MYRGRVPHKWNRERYESEYLYLAPHIKNEQREDLLQNEQREDLLQAEETLPLYELPVEEEALPTQPSGISAIFKAQPVPEVRPSEYPGIGYTGLTSSDEQNLKEIAKLYREALPLNEEAEFSWQAPLQDKETELAEILLQEEETELDEVLLQEEDTELEETVLLEEEAPQHISTAFTESYLPKEISEIKQTQKSPQIYTEKELPLAAREIPHQPQRAALANRLISGKNAVLEALR